MKMKINLQTSVLVKPAEPTLNGPLPLSDLDLVSGNYFVPIIFIYKPLHNNLPSRPAVVELLKSSLSKILVPFYPLSGRVGRRAAGGRHHIECNAMGVQFTEATSEAAWDDLTVTDYDQLVPFIDENLPLWQLPLLSVQITFFNCGGICLGVTMWHPMADGLSASYFYTGWARIARGETLIGQPFIDRKPLFDVGREHYSTKSTQPRRLVEFEKPPVLVAESGNEKVTKKPTTKEFLRLSKSQVEVLKRSANKSHLGDFNPAFSRFESITAHIWKCMCKARGHKHDQETRLTTTVDIRKRVQPPLPKTILGNAVVEVVALDCAGHLISNPLSYAASRIRAAIKKVTPEYINETVGFLRGLDDLSSVHHNFDLLCSDPNIGVVSWLSLDFQGLDFGWGKEIYMAPVTATCDGDFVIIPGGHDCKGSVDIAMCFQEAHMEAFKKFFYEDISGI